MESQPQIPEIRIKDENFHPCSKRLMLGKVHIN